MEGYIYVLTSPSDKNYIGQSWNVESRWNSYMKMYNNKSQIKLYRALKKYGPENFIFYIIDAAKTQEELDRKEQYWIDSYDSIKRGYNCKEGGRFCKAQNPRNEEISIRVDGYQFQIIKEKAKEFGFKNISEYIREMCLHGQLIAYIDQRYLP